MMSLFPTNNPSFLPACGNPSYIPILPQIYISIRNMLPLCKLLSIMIHLQSSAKNGHIIIIFFFFFMCPFWALALFFMSIPYPFQHFKLCVPSRSASRQPPPVGFSLFYRPTLNIDENSSGCSTT